MTHCPICSKEMLAYLKTAHKGIVLKGPICRKLGVSQPVWIKKILKRNSGEKSSPQKNLKNQGLLIAPTSYRLWQGGVFAGLHRYSK